MSSSLMLLIFFFIRTLDSIFLQSNTTDFSKCSVYYSRSGSVYKDFFEINENLQNASTILDFHFSVLSPSDAHILLAPSSQIKKGDPVYEIVIGAGGNTFCDIRRMQKSDVKATTRIKGLLSGLDVQSFWLHINKDGFIEIGKEGQYLSFMNWTDPDPLPLKVFSFSTWSGVEAKWFFDCPIHNSSTHSQKIERPLTDLEQLRKDLLYMYDPNVRPVYNFSKITPVELQISTILISLNEYKASLFYSGTITMSWYDEKLHWNSSDYGNLNDLHIFRREIWIPNLHLFNAVENGSNILQDTLLTVNSSGYVTWTSTANMISWCSPDDLGRWPRDQHYCNVVLGFLKDVDKLQLIFKANESTFNVPYSANWVITSVVSYSNKGWANGTLTSIQTLDPPSLILNFDLKRISNSYTILYFTPFFVIITSLLVTFWMSPFNQLKLSLTCLQLILTTMVLIGLGLIIPVHSQLVPNLVLLYSYTIIAIAICIIIETIVINLSRNEHQESMPHLLRTMISCNFLKMVLLLPTLESSEQYGNLNTSFPKLNENKQTSWILLGIIIDRISFLVYLNLVIYALCINY